MPRIKSWLWVTDRKQYVNCADTMFQTLWMWRQEYQHHEQLPLAFNGTWPSWNSDLDNRPW